MPRYGLSAIQLLATALAAITATIAASYLGVSGTVIGAALASVVSAIGTAVYGHSLRTTHARVRDVVPGRRADSVTVDQDFLSDARSDAHPARTAEENVIGGRAQASHAQAPHAQAPHAQAVRARWRGVAIGSAATFAALLAIVTTVEVVIGRPISDVVRGDSGSGTSLFGATNRAAGPGATPTVTRTVTPAVVVTTPTVTRTAPAVTETAGPTVTTSPSATSAGPSAPASGSPVPSGSASTTP